VRFDIEQTELEYSEQTHWPRPDDQNIGLNGLTHTCHPGTDRAPRSQ